MTTGELSSRSASGVTQPPSLLAQPRLVVGIVLVLAGIAWGAARGLDFYGLAPFRIAYDLDQPPLLLIMAGVWLAYRSRR